MPEQSNTGQQHLLLACCPTGGKLNTGGELAGSLVELLSNAKTEVTRFEGIGALESLYIRTAPASRQGELGTLCLVDVLG